MKHYWPLILILSNFVLGETQAKIPIRINAPYANAYTTEKIKSVVKEILENQGIDLSGDKYYTHAKVSFKSNTNHFYLLISLNNRALFSKKVFSVMLDKNFKILSISKGYSGDDKESTLAQCPNPTIKFLIANPYADSEEDLKSADYAASQVYAAATAKYGKDAVMMLSGLQGSVKNFEDYLSCPNLKGVYSMASHDEQGQSFFLADGTFNYRFFYDQPNLNYTDTIISFNTCYAYEAIVPGLCYGATGLSPRIYTAGVTPLTLYGSPEAYACFWTQVLSKNKQPTKNLLETCARKHDPFAKDSHSPLYIIGPPKYETPFDSFKITTNQSSYTVTQDDYYIRLSLGSNEFVTKITLVDKAASFDCKGAEGLFNQPGLKASEFILGYDGKACQIMQFKASDYPEQFPKGYAVYGVSPYDQCGNG